MIHVITKKIVTSVTTLTGFEPATSGFEVQCAIQLRHKVITDTIMYEAYVYVCAAKQKIFDRSEIADGEIRTRDPLLTRQVQ